MCHGDPLLVAFHGHVHVGQSRFPVPAEVWLWQVQGWVAPDTTIGNGGLWNHGVETDHYLGSVPAPFNSLLLCFGEIQELKLYFHKVTEIDCWVTTQGKALSRAKCWVANISFAATAALTEPAAFKSWDLFLFICFLLIPLLRFQFSLLKLF